MIPCDSPAARRSGRSGPICRSPPLPSRNRPPAVGHEAAPVHRGRTGPAAALRAPAPRLPRRGACRPSVWP
jgi:hypothetical protein